MATLNDALLRDIRHDRDFIRNDSGDLTTEEGLDNIKNAIFRRLITSPGTIIHRPTYGVGIKDYQNALSSLANQRTLATRIGDQLPLDDRVESVEGVRFEVEDASPEKFKVILRVKIEGFGEDEMVFTPFSEGVA